MKSLFLGAKCVQSSRLNTQVVSRGSETQLEVGENLNDLSKRSG